MRKAIAYIRVSTEDQKLGMDAQLKAIQTYCNQQGYVLGGVHTDHGVSGGLELDKRPALQDALDQVANEKPAVLIVAKRCRLARDGYVAAMVYRLVERMGGKVECADGVGNGDGAEDKLMRGMLDLFAEYERELIRGRTRAALAAKRRRKEYTGGRRRWGWDVDEESGKETPNQSEQEIAKRAKSLRKNGSSYRAIVRAFTDQKIPTRDGGKWNPMRVRTVALSELC
jgi:site-specific DNA recombinase